MDDLISRQAAIDALGEEPMVWTNDNEYALGERNQWQLDKLAIETVQAADVVEIVRCPDCIKADLCAWRREGAEYCSYAERRTDETD